MAGVLLLRGHTSHDVYFSSSSIKCLEIVGSGAMVTDCDCIMEDSKHSSEAQKIKAYLFTLLLHGNVFYYGS